MRHGKRHITDGGFAALDAMVGAGIAALLALGAVDSVRAIARKADAAERSMTAWMLAQSLVEMEEPSTDGVDDAHNLYWRTSKGPDRIAINSDVQFEIISVEVRGPDGALLASLAKRRLKLVTAP